LICYSFNEAEHIALTFNLLFLPLIYHFFSNHFFPREDQLLSQEEFLEFLFDKDDIDPEATKLNSVMKELRKLRTLYSNTTNNTNKVSDHDEKTEMLVTESEALAETPKRNKEFNTSNTEAIFQNWQ